MLAGKKQEWRLGRVFVNGQEVERLTLEQQQKAVNAMGRVLNDKFSQDPEMYLRVCAAADAQVQAASA